MEEKETVNKKGKKMSAGKRNFLLTVDYKEFSCNVPLYIINRRMEDFYDSANYVLSNG